VETERYYWEEGGNKWEEVGEIEVQMGKWLRSKYILCNCDNVIMKSIILYN
jgi:hypothetical protein